MEKENKNEKENEEKNEDDKDSNDRVATTTPADFLIIYDDKMIYFASYETNWVVDSVASIYATSQKDVFTSYRSVILKLWRWVIMAWLKSLVL